MTTIAPAICLVFIVTFAIGATFLNAQRGQPGTSGTLILGTPIERGLRSGAVDEYAVKAGAGDLVSGTIEVRGLAVVVEVVDATGVVIHADYSFEASQPVLTRVGFVAPTTATYSVRIKAFDRFSEGPQWAPGELAMIVGSASGSYILRLEDTPVDVRLRGVDPTTRIEYPSARLERLAQDLRAGLHDTLESFWLEVASTGPIVAAAPGDETDVDVTFLWREVYDTRNVLLEWCPRADDCYMSRLPGTDVWYKTIRLRRGSRINYYVSPNDRAEDRWATGQLDPLNRRAFPDDPTYRFVRSSVLETPGAPDEGWAVRPPARRGLIVAKKLRSALLGGERDIWIYTPPDYAPGAGPYPFLLLLDGPEYMSNRFLNAPTTLDNLINEGRIKPTIVCFDGGNRGNAVETAGSESTYSRVVAKEVMPLLRASYPIGTNPADNVIGGFSAGGRAAAEIAFFHPDVFGNVLSQSGSFCDCYRGLNPGSYEPNSNARAYLTAPHKPIRFYLDAGLYDSVTHADLPIHEQVLEETNLMGNRHLRDALRAKGYDVIYREVGGGHNDTHWRPMLADGLMALLGTAGK